MEQIPKELRIAKTYTLFSKQNSDNSEHSGQNSRETFNNIQEKNNTSLGMNWTIQDYNEPFKPFKHLANIATDVENKNTLVRSLIYASAGRVLDPLHMISHTT